MKLVFTTQNVPGTRQKLHIASMTADDGEVLVVNGVYAEASGANRKDAANNLKYMYNTQRLIQMNHNNMAIELLEAVA